MLVNRIKLADVLGCSLPTVDKYMAEGAPYIDRPGEKGKTQWAIDTGDVIQWLIARASGQEGAKTNEMDAMLLRERTAIVGLKELELGRQQKVLIHVDEVAEVVNEQFAVVKSRIMALPARLTQQLAVEDDPIKVRQILKDEVFDVLESIAGDETGIIKEELGGPVLDEVPDPDSTEIVPVKGDKTDE